MANAAKRAKKETQSRRGREDFSGEEEAIDGDRCERMNLGVEVWARTVAESYSEW